MSDKVIPTRTDLHRALRDIQANPDKLEREMAQINGTHLPTLKENAGPVKVRITRIRSDIRYNQKQKDTLRALGLTRINASKILEITPSIAGMINRVSHMLRVEILNEAGEA